jgi:hypothetical protein
MSANDAPLSGYWAHQTARDTRASAETMELADQIAAELDRVESGEFPLYVVTARYTSRELLAAMCHWGLTSDRSRQLKEDLWGLRNVRQLAAD